MSEEEGGPDSGLGEGVDRDASGEGQGDGSEDGEEEEGDPGAEEVATEGSEGRTEGAADASIGFGDAYECGAEVEAELEGVGLDEIEVEADKGGDEENDEDGGELEDEGGAAYIGVVDVVVPSGFEFGEGAEDDGRDEEGDTDESPEVE